MASKARPIHKRKPRADAVAIWLANRQHINLIDTENADLRRRVADLEAQVHFIKTTWAAELAMQMAQGLAEGLRETFEEARLNNSRARSWGGP